MTDTEHEQVDTELPPRAPIEFRAAQTLDVRYPDRIIKLLVVPYDVEAVAVHEGRLVLESFAPGSFAGVEHRAGRIKVNRDHDLALTCGRAIALAPSDASGLIADVRISRTPLGDDTLEMAADGVLDASVGFAPMPGGEVFLEQRSKRRITRAYLGHIALVPDPAYTGAGVLSVRSAGGVGEAEAARAAAGGTPNKDAVLAMLAELGYPAAISK